MATSAGTYKGVNITAGTDAQIAAQMKAIDAKATTATTTTTPKVDTTSVAYQQQLAQISTGVQSVAAQVPAITQSVNTLSQAKAAGMTITGKTSVEEAQQYLTPTSTTDLAKSQADTFTPPASTASATMTSYAQGMTDTLDKQRAALESAYQTQLANVQTQLTEAQKKQDEYLAEQKDILETEVKPLTEPFRADLETAERERLKIEENYFANQQLTNELDTLLTQIQSDLQKEKDVTGLASIRQPRIEKATEDAAARVGVIEAVMAARNNQITVAENLIDRTVSAMTADRNDQLTYYNALLGFYDKQVDIEGNKIIALTSQEQGWIKSKIGLLENDLAVTQSNVENIKAAMTDPDTALAYASSGVTLNDTPEQINVKLANYAYSQELSNTSNSMANEGYSYLSPGQTSPTGSQVVTTTDSQGKTKQWYKEAETNQQVVGSAETGYSLVSYDNQGNVVKQTPISGGVGGGTTGITAFDDLLQAAINDGASPEAAARAIATISENQGIQVSTKMLEDWKNKASKMTPQTTTETVATTTAGGIVPWVKGQVEEMKSFFGSLFGR
jgi:hypothetical protein